MAEPPFVRLAGVPAALFLESQNHQHDVIRELALIEIGGHFHENAQPHERVGTLISEILHQYSEVRATTRHQALRAVASGASVVTLTVPIEHGMVAALRRWLELVEEADALCQEGAFLTLPTSAGVRTLRRWYVDAIADAVDEGPGAARTFPHSGEEVEHSADS